MPAGKDGIDFDPVAFETGIMTKVNESINGAMGGIKKDFQKMLDGLKAAPPEEKKVEPIEEKKLEPMGEPKTIAEVNSQLQRLTKDLERTSNELKAEKEAKVKAETAKLETDRVAAFDQVISDFSFATPKAKQQFRNAYLNSIKRDENGSLIVDTDKGPMDMAGYLKGEYDESTHLQPPVGRGGAGASPSRQSGANTFNFRPDMTPAEINALSPELKSSYRQQLSEAIIAGGH